MRPYDWILPGLGHLRHGFAKQSRKYLLFMGAWVAVVIFRWDRIAALAAGNVEWAESIEIWVALGFLAVWPLVWMWAARRGLHRLLEPPLRTSLSQWQVAMGLFRKNKRGAIGLRILGLAYMIAFLCPVLSPYDPERLPRAGIVLNGLRPFATVYVLGDSRRGNDHGAVSAREHIIAGNHSHPINGDWNVGNVRLDLVSARTDSLTLAIDRELVGS